MTGASRGIGLGVAHRLVAEGAKVTITARKRPALEAAVEELGGPDHALAVDGSADDAGHQLDTVRRTLETFGRVDVLVNNSGINPAYGPMLDLDSGAARKILEVNLLAVLDWVRLVHRHWMAENGGAVVNVASLAGVRPARGIGFYGSSKAALMHLTSQLALELGPKVRVNAVAPAVVRTRFAAMLYEGREAAVTEDYPLGRLGEPADVAAAAAFLASADAAWVTGQTLILDGGLSLGAGVLPPRPAPLAAARSPRCRGRNAVSPRPRPGLQGRARGRPSAGG